MQYALPQGRVKWESLQRQSITNLSTSRCITASLGQIGIELITSFNMVERYFQAVMWREFQYERLSWVSEYIVQNVSIIHYVQVVSLGPSSLLNQDLVHTENDKASPRPLQVLRRDQSNMQILDYHDVMPFNDVTRINSQQRELLRHGHSLRRCEVSLSEDIS